MLFKYADAANSGTLATREFYKTSDDFYFGNDDADDLFATIKRIAKQQPGIKIRLIGHSLGGWCAAKLSKRLHQAGIGTSLLITIDPVGVAYFMRIADSESEPPRPVADVWVNIVAEHAKKYGVDDIIADAGTRWRPSRDWGLKIKPTFDYNTPFSHADVWKMMVFQGAKGKSAWEILITPPAK